MSLTTNEVTFVSYSVDNATAALNNKVLSASNSYVINAVVLTSVLVNSGQSSDTVYTQLSAALTNAVEVTGTFTIFLQFYAGQNNASAVSSASATTVSNGPAVETDVSSSGGASNSLNTGELAGIVIGSIVGVALLLVLVYYLVMARGGLRGGALAKQGKMSSEGDDNI